MELTRETDLIQGAACEIAYGRGPDHPTSVPTAGAARSVRVVPQCFPVQPKVQEDSWGFSGVQFTEVQRTWVLTASKGEWSPPGQGMN